MDLDVLRRIAEEMIPYNRWLGLVAVGLEPGKVRFEIPWRDEFVGDWTRPALHGGVLSALADVAAGMAVWSAVDDPHTRVSTIDLRVDYLRPGKLERVAAEAAVVRVGGRVGVADVRMFHVTNEAETIATGKGVYAIVSRPPIT